MTDIYEACKECIIKSTCNKDTFDNTACEKLISEKLKDYLEYNFMPSITNPAVIDVTINILEQFQNGNYDFEIETTEGKVPAIEIAEDLRLHNFIEY